MDSSTADMCSRCASIPWDDLEYMDTESFWIDEKPTLGDLQASSCRLCRLITTAITRNPARDAHLESAVNIFWRSTTDHGDDCLGSLGLGLGQEGFAGELILTTKFIGENAKAWSTVASRRFDFAKTRQNLEVCRASHKSCEPKTSPQLHNLRVIDCMEKSVVVAPRGCLFVALSYVWGELSADSYVLGSRIAFPRTIEDAVKSTQELGHRYLWVDRYCIDQENPCDKEEQIGQMGHIYASAQVTIVAAAGADPSHGLMGISRDRKTLSAQEPVGSSRLLCLFPRPIHDYIAHSPWFSRAWTLQEGYLSKRILCFTERDAVFACKSSKMITESVTYPHRFTTDSHANMENTRTALSIQCETLLDANSIMKAYSRRARGHESDMLNAIVGVLNVLKNGSSPVYHIWGVPFTITQRLNDAHTIDSIASISLNWYHPRSARRLPEFPSWSTLGWIGQVYDWGESEVTPHFMIKYWSGEIYQELDNGTCDLDYKYYRDVTHRSQYLEITTDVVQIELCSGRRDDIISYFLQPTFIRPKEVRDQKEVCPNTEVQSPFFWLNLDDETTFDFALPVVCATMTPPEIDSGSWRSFLDKHPLLLVFQQKAKSYERIGACHPLVYTINREGEYTFDPNPDLWEFVPHGEPGAWDQVAERRTFLLG